jgi:hypothetical protein
MLPESADLMDGRPHIHSRILPHVSPFTGRYHLHYNLQLTTRCFIVSRIQTHVPGY